MAKNDGEAAWRAAQQAKDRADREHAAGNEQVNLATFEGTDGNGYYGTGYWISVERAES